MAMPTGELRPYLRSFDFQGLFVEGLGWDFYRAQPTRISVDNQEYILEPVAEKAGFAVYVCNPDDDGHIPDYPVRRKIEWNVTKIAYEHLIIFVDAAKTTQIWQWVKREVGKSAAYREHPLYTTQTGTPLLQRLSSFVFTLEDESKGIAIKDVTDAVSKALDVEKVTKRFYDRFRKELIAFQKLITGIDGITATGDREWYASLLLNRMMFAYFIQKQGFLDGDADYLRNRLRMVQSKYGSGRFQEFYRDFLVRLFHEGLGQPESKRKTELHDLLGRVPYLNGGLFDVHDLEQYYTKISIPDKAFERIFDFFDGYRWHLDERPRREDNEINPDVLGYIFEKYINQKQMGAYYTKEDITGYITRNTIIPFLLDTAKKECPASFDSDGVWCLLRNEPDRYIYAAAGHGTAWTYSPDADPLHLEKALDLPEDIMAGLDDVAQRGGWNRSASPEYALPTETWRELIARRQHYREVRNKMAAGGVSEVNDLITLNLDIERFAKDVIAQSEGPKLLRAFWKAINSVSVLDPTCGSGAFLFAALNILEPLYTACLEGMRGFVEDMERSSQMNSATTLGDFRAVLEQVDEHPNQRYFILKSIILNNLYGVDIMEEAVEICKLRLFLKMMAHLEGYNQIEPLPDIDFNIRAGNTLVGFTSLDGVQKAMQTLPGGQSRFVTDKDKAVLARINEAAKIVSQSFDQFRSQQTNPDSELAQKSKIILRSNLDTLRDELDRYLAVEYGIDAKKSAAYEAWRDSHRPFHWFVEFHGIMDKGGFDVVVGNPPFVEYRKVVKDYAVKGYSTLNCGNLCYFVCEQSINILTIGGRWGLVTPIASISTDRTAKFQNLLNHGFECWTSSFSNRPAKLFDGVEQRITLLIAKKMDGEKLSNHFSTGFSHWYANERSVLFDRLRHTDINNINWSASVAKAGTTNHAYVLAQLLRHKPSLKRLITTNTTKHVIYYHNGPTYWIRATNFNPNLSVSSRSSHYVPLTMQDKDAANTMVCILNSSLFYIWFKSFSNCRDFTLREILRFRLPQIDAKTKRRLKILADELMRGYLSARSKKSRNYPSGYVEYYEYYPQQLKATIDKIDGLLAELYGFTDEKLDFITNYDIKYRLG